MILFFLSLPEPHLPRVSTYDLENEKTNQLPKSQILYIPDPAPSR